MPRLHSAHTGPPSSHNQMPGLVLQASDMSTTTGAKNDRRARSRHPISVGATRASQGITLNHLATGAAR